MGFSKAIVEFYYVCSMKKITRVTEIVLAYTLTFYAYIKVFHKMMFS